MLFYRILADAVLLLHAAFVAFVVVGQVLIVVGLVLKWRWVRNFWFRVLHLLAIVFVVAQTWLRVACPLSLVENNLRERAGQEPYTDNGCVADWLHRILFFQAETWVFTLCYSLFGAAVVLTFILGRPKWPARSPSGRG